MRKPLIAGNWKMYKTIQEMEEFIQNFLLLVSGMTDREILLCAPFTGLSTLQSFLQGKSHIHLGAQNMYWEDEGAFTGEISARMLKNVGCSYVIIGHSERRALFGETNETTKKKIVAAWREDLQPIYCVGEHLEERERGQAYMTIEKQLTQSLGELDGKNHPLVIAYEPIWAIGTGVHASEQDAQDMAKFIRCKIATIFDRDTAEKTRILYGGSVKPTTIDALMQQEDIDGVLVGGASLDPQDFAKIVRFQK